MDIFHVLLQFKDRLTTPHEFYKNVANFLLIQDIDHVNE